MATLILASLSQSPLHLASAWNPSTSNLSGTFASSTNYDVADALNAKRRFDIDTLAEYGMQAGDDGDSLALLMKTIKLQQDYIPPDHDASNVESTQSEDTATAYPFQRKSFYAEGRYWMFYSDGTNIVYKTSTSGTTWGSATTVRAGTKGYEFSVYFDGTYLHYAYSDGVAGNPLYYRRGDPSASGTISWSQTEQPVWELSKNLWSCPTICVDSDGCPWIGFYRYYEQGQTKIGYATVAASTATDGTWSTRTGFPLNVYTCDSPTSVFYTVVVPLKSSRVLALYVDNAYVINSKLWTGSSWDFSESVMSGTDRPSQSHGWSVTSKGDQAYLATGDSSSNIKFKKYTYGVGWGGVETAHTGASILFPVLSVAENWDIYVFWASTSTVYYKRRIGGTWDGSYYSLITGETSIQTYEVTCFQTSFENSNKKPCIGFAYMTYTGNYPVKFKTIIIAGFCVEDMIVADQYEINFTIGSRQFCMVFEATGSKAGKCRLFDGDGSTWTPDDYVTVADIQSGTEYHDAQTHVGFVLTNSTSSSGGSIKFIMSKSYMQSLGATGNEVTGIVSLAYESGTGSPKTSGTPNDMCPSSGSASYTMGGVPEFPVGGLILAIPAVAIYVCLRRLSHSGVSMHGGSS